MNVVLVCVHDWANVGYTFEKSLRSVGVNAISFAKFRHIFNYPQQAQNYNKNNPLQPYIQKADVVIFMHSQYVDTEIDLTNKIVGVVHTGTSYRKNLKQVNKFFNRRVDICFTTGDLVGSGAKNEVWVQPAIDCNNLQPLYFDGIKNLVIGHYPTRRKGTQIIIKEIERIRKKNFSFVYDTNFVSWERQMDRMSKCDIYIEDMNPQNVSFGTTGLEAAALGKIVFTRFSIKNEYEKVFCPCPIQDCDDNNLADKLTEILSMSDNEIVEFQKRSRKWVEDCHSFEATGRRLKEALEGVTK